MILSKPSWHNLTGEARTTARLDELARRLDSWEAAQYANWSFAADSRGAELESRQAGLEEKMAAFEAKILGLPEAIFEEAQLQALADRVAYLELDNGELTRRLDTALQLIEGLARAAGFAPWSGSSEDWPEWVRHVSGALPVE